MIEPVRMMGLSGKAGIEYFRQALRAAGIGNAAERLCLLAEKETEYLQGKRRMPALLQRLEDRWYRSLEAGSPDYLIYKEEDYLAELWACWTVYARKYLRCLLDTKVVPPAGAAGELSGAKLIVDVGNGIGASTAALTQMFPEARVIGTNILTTPQAKVGQVFAETYGFEMVEDPVRLGQADLLFASEYFEHFDAPLDHLIHLLEVLEPKAVLVANTFSAISTGHFPTYRVGFHFLKGSAVSKQFNELLKFKGYFQKGRFWNNRPAYWVKKSANPGLFSFGPAHT